MYNIPKIFKTIFITMAIILSMVIIVLFINYKANRILVVCRQMIENKNFYKRLDMYYDYNIKYKRTFDSSLIIINVCGTNKNKIPKELKWLIPQTISITDNYVLIDGLLFNIRAYRNGAKEIGDIKIIDGLYKEENRR